MPTRSNLLLIALQLLATAPVGAQPVIDPAPSPVDSPAEPLPTTPSSSLDPEAAPPQPTGSPAKTTPTPDEPGPKQKKKTKKQKKKAIKKQSEKIVFSGFITAMYKFRVDHNGDDRVEPDAFRLGKVVLRADGKLDRHFGYQIEIDPRSPTLAGVLRDGYIRVTKVVPHHQIRIGQQKTPWGYENWLSSTELYFTSRTELSEGLGRGLTHRDLGIGLVGKLPLTDQWRIEDQVAIVNGDGFGVQADSTQRKNLWAHVAARYKTDQLELRFGLSGAIGDQIEPPDPGAPSNPRVAFRRVGADVEIDQKWLFLGAEYALGWDEDPAGSGDRERQSAYFVTLAGKTPWHIGPVVRYETADLEQFKRFTAGLYWGKPKSRVRVLSDYEYFEDEFGKHDARVETQLQLVF